MPPGSPTAAVASIAFLLLACGGTDGVDSTDAGNADDDASAGDGTPASDGAPPGTAPLRVGINVHLEGYTDSQHADHVGFALDRGAEFAARGMPLTFEASDRFLQREGDLGWTTLADLEAQGHAIGAHGDVFTYEDSYQQSVDHFLDLKSMLAAQGVSATHASGQCTALDWVSIVTDAGFNGVSGCVGYCLLSMPESLWATDYPEVVGCDAPNLCHNEVPGAVAEQIHPWRTDDGANWLAAASSGIVIVPAIGNIVCLAESAAGTGDTMCPYDAADNDQYFSTIDEAFKLMQHDGKETLLLTWSLGNPLTDSLVEDLFTSLESYVAAGTIQWQTVPEMIAAQ